MEVQLVTATTKPITTCGYAAGICYNKDVANEPYQKKYNRIKHCIEVNHFGVIEHASATWHVKGISRACANQLVRHRIASYCQKSERYCKLKLGDYEEWFVMPDKVAENEELKKQWLKALEKAKESYEAALEAGIPAEDARAILPQNATTDIVITMNMRSFTHFMELRTSKRAQKEIRDLAGDMVLALLSADEEYADLLSLLVSKMAEEEKKNKHYKLVKDIEKDIKKEVAHSQIGKLNTTIE